jgi:hypothetical protein
MSTANFTKTAYIENIKRTAKSSMLTLMNCSLLEQGKSNLEVLKTQYCRCLAIYKLDAFCSTNAVLYVMIAVTSK